MKIYSFLRFILQPLRNNKPINPVKLAKARKALASMNVDQLRDVLHTERRKSRDWVAQLGLRKPISTNFQAFVDLNRSAKYYENGKLLKQAYYTIPAWNAAAFIAQRHLAVNLPILPISPTLAAVNLESLQQAQQGMTPEAINAWAGISQPAPVQTPSPKRTGIVQRGGLTIDLGAPFSVPELVAKLAKVEGKKADKY